MKKIKPFGIDCEHCMFYKQMTYDLSQCSICKRKTGIGRDLFVGTNPFRKQTNWFNRMMK